MSSLVARPSEWLGVLMRTMASAAGGGGGGGGGFFGGGGGLVERLEGAEGRRESGVLSKDFVIARFHCRVGLQPSLDAHHLCVCACV